MKTNPDVLISEIAEDFNQFLMHGDLSTFSKEIDPNLKINDIERLLRIHFVLTSKEHDGEIGVIDFIEQLPQRLRRIKTTIKAETDVFEGEVRGRINWKDTIKYRYSENPFNNSLYVCDKREKNYDIPENLVLKSLLQIIHEIVYSDLAPAFKDEYPWLKGWIGEGRDLREDLDHVYLKNVYLKRISMKKPMVTDRMISRAINSRIQLYKDAAVLLSRYRRLMAYELDSNEARELLKNTFIKPDRVEVLFELYWAIKIVKELFKEPRFQLIERGRNMVAKWEDGEYIYRIYHDSIGSFEFKENIKNLIKNLKDEDNYFGRELKVLEKLEKMIGVKSDDLWGGRPDILLEKFDKDNNLVSVFIGEVKYTDQQNYAIKGLKELLEYMALIKKDGRYFEDINNLFDALKNVSGALFIDKIEGLDVDIGEDDKVQIIRHGDNMEKLKLLISLK